MCLFDVIQVNAIHVCIYSMCDLPCHILLNVLFEPEIIANTTCLSFSGKSIFVLIASQAKFLLLKDIVRLDADKESITHSHIDDLL